MFPGFDPYSTDPAHHLVAVGQDLDDLHRHLSGTRYISPFPTPANVYTEVSVLWNTPFLIRYIDQAGPI